MTVSEHICVRPVNTTVLRQADQITGVITLDKVIERLRNDRGWKQHDLAKAAGISQSAIGNLEAGLRGNKGRIPSTLPAIARAFGMSTDSLLEMAGYTKPSRSGKSTTGRAHPNTAEGPEIKGRIPLISWIQAGSWAEIIDTFHPGDAEEWLPCSRSHSSRSFVLRVDGDSMLNLGGRPSFQSGDLIFIDPERDAHHRSLVVVKLPGENKATFKQLLIDGERRYLQALNPAWPERISELSNEAQIVGVVFFKGEDIG